MAGIDPISNVADAAAKIISLFKQDPNIKAAGLQALNEAQLQGQIQMILGNLEINKVEAANPSLFVAGWRPFVGWVCGSALAYGMIIQPFAQFILASFNVVLAPGALPTLDLTQTIGLLVPLLGLGYFRTQEKIAGAAPGVH